MSDSPDPRLLLLEFVNADQFPGRLADIAPLVQGDCISRGIPTRWLRFGISTTNLLQHQRDEITLDDEELATLEAVVDEFRPTTILSTDPLFEEQVARLRDRVPRLVVEDLVEGRGARLIEEIPSLLRALDTGGGPWPTYDFEPGNQAARNKQLDNVYLLMPERCGHPRRLAGNPLYQAVRDRRVDVHTGCAFCSNWMDVTREGAVRPVAPVSRALAAKWIDRQFHAIARSRGTPERFPHAVLLTTLPSPGDFAQCLASLRDSGMAAHVQLLFGARPDLVPSVAKVLRQLYADDPASPVKTGVYACGVESLYRPELTLYNKGTSPLDGLVAINTLRELAEELPGRFWHTGLSFLLFTPWSSFEGLHLNYGLIRFFGLDRKIAGNMFQSRLRLHRQLPMTALAETQGLTLEQEADPVLTMNRRKLFSSESAWRYRDPRVRPLSRNVLRYDILDSPLADDLAHHVLRGIRTLRPEWDGGDDRILLDLTLAQIELLLDACDPPDEAELFDRAVARVRAQSERPLCSHDHRIGCAALPLELLLARLQPALDGEARVLSVGEVGVEQLAGCAPWIEQQGWHAAIVDRRGQPARRGKLFLATDPAALAERIGLEQVLGTSLDPAARRQAAARAGRLHGFPACCVDAYAAHPSLSLLPLSWAAFLWRLDAGELPDTCMPLLVPALGFVPCTASCRTANAYFGRMFDRVGVQPRSQLAWVFSLDQDRSCDCAALHAREHDDSSLGYVAEATQAHVSALGETLAAGDTLALVPGQIQIKAGSSLRALLTASHALWYPARCWHPAEWRELARSRVLDARAAIRSPAHAPAASLSAQDQKRTQGMEPLITVVVDDRAASSSYRFHVGLFAEGQPCYLRVGSLALWYSHDTMTPRAVAVARVVEAAMRSESGPLCPATCARWTAGIGRLGHRAGWAGKLSFTVTWVGGQSSRG